MMTLPRTTDYFEFLDRNPLFRPVDLRRHFGIAIGIATEAYDAWLRYTDDDPELSAEERARLYHSIRVRV